MDKKPNIDFEEAKLALRKKDFSTAIAGIRAHAERGDIRAQILLGILLEDGEGVEADIVEAMKWYRKAAEQGNARAQSRLAQAFMNGDGLAQDYGEAMHWAKDAAVQHEKSALAQIGLMHERGYGVARSNLEAAKYYRLAAIGGGRFAQIKLWQFYWSGKGVPRNRKKSMKFVEMAALGGDFEAQRFLGFLELDSGILGAPPNRKRATKWLNMAAEQGDFVAQATLAGKYIDAPNGQKNYVLAYKWVRLALALWDDTWVECREYAFKDLDWLRQNMSLKKIEVAERLISAWVQKRLGDELSGTTSDRGSPECSGQPNRRFGIQAERETQ